MDALFQIARGEYHHGAVFTMSSVLPVGVAGFGGGVVGLGGVGGAVGGDVAGAVGVVGFGAVAGGLPVPDVARGAVAVAAAAVV